MNALDYRTCGCCRAVKSRANFCRDKSQADGLRFYCRECVRTKHGGAPTLAVRRVRSKAAYWRNPQIVRDRVKNWRDSNLEKVISANRRIKLRNYGLTPERFEEMNDAQNGCCAICGR